jgi:hypothetical protein
MRFYILFQLVYDSDYLHTSLFIPTYQTAIGIISPVEFARENHDLNIRGQPVISYIYFCEQWYANCLAYFSNPLPVMDQKLN